jgi:bifunctional non-homologous end joining protein LigD
MALEEYQRKRDFEKTSEPPPGKVKAGNHQLSYLIQKHDAIRLHYDFRAGVRRCAAELGRYKRSQP